MTQPHIHVILLAVSLILLFAQLGVRNKKTLHILFAIFCGSVAMTAAKRITGADFGPYQYLIGMLACATCNCFWLIARALFREKNPIAWQHIAVAITIAVLVVFQQGYLFVTAHWTLHSRWLSLLVSSLGEVTLLLSSGILMLSCWEACRGFNRASRRDKQQRIVFLSIFGSAILISKTAQNVLNGNPAQLDLITSLLTIGILICLQALLIWRSTLRKQAQEDTTAPHAHSLKPLAPSAEATNFLAKQIHNLIIEQQGYLQTNLKVADIARKLDVSEYKISKTLREHMGARNFNQYINELRIQHAMQLLSDADKQHWSVLVVGLESGFASVGPFTRAFKAYTGSTPNQYRQTLPPATQVSI
ncbi:helix-turn-helix transcriptional regulator [Pseudoalteromonas luteoviolacea]|uniref:AraC-type DNA-binding domain-containing protein n=1 Tax=Pseudoalteromonas luteoviolacea (strain 2ta16) TaxID=1353533 RepID=V4JBX7_PSEL2|nr:helix-turn-helix transcriptional regulator [Pseudoalteromonas luteoviolacea]ESP92637.1 AraC-type DNA-binding domain-containing protein [Pseudoalteromonas luteoviolacea 2ta16]KZN35445.1 hypothetical protein N483_00405 [Pseudoalteromonas luteoviolacea NCIMB 1944]